MSARIVVTLATILTCAVYACDRVAFADSREEFVEAKGHSVRGEPGEDPDRFSCTVGDDEVSVTKTGKVAWSHRGQKPVEVAIPSDRARVEEGLVRQVWCAQVDGDLLLVHRSDDFGPDGDSIGGGVCRIAAEGTTEWSVRVPGNTGEPLKFGKFLYVSGIGFVGKLDLDSGQFVWRHDKLFRDPGVYNAFARARREGGRVLFRAVHHNLGRPVPKQWPEVLIVDDESGAIIDGAPRTGAN